MLRFGPFKMTVVVVVVVAVVVVVVAVVVAAVVVVLGVRVGVRVKPATNHHRLHDEPSSTAKYKLSSASYHLFRSESSAKEATLQAARRRPNLAQLFSSQSNSHKNKHGATKSGTRTK